MFQGTVTKPEETVQVPLVLPNEMKALGEVARLEGMTSQQYFQTLFDAGTKVQQASENGVLPIARMLGEPQKNGGFLQPKAELLTPGMMEDAPAIVLRVPASTAERWKESGPDQMISELVPILMQGAVEHEMNKQKLTSALAR